MARMSDKERGYAHRVDILADAAVVWRALTEEPLLARWCCPGAQIQPRQGGTVPRAASTA